MSSLKHSIIFLILYLLNLLYFIVIYRISQKDTSLDPRVFHHENEFARGKSHVNGIESFWSYAKRRFAKFNGLSNEKFLLHLKETECRFNHREENFGALVASLFWQKKKKDASLDPLFFSDRVLLL